VTLILYDETGKAHNMMWQDGLLVTVTEAFSILCGLPQTVAFLDDSLACLVDMLQALAQNPMMMEHILQQPCLLEAVFGAILNPGPKKLRWLYEPTLSLIDNLLEALDGPESGNRLLSIRVVDTVL
jgi:hypothetical protein